MSIKMNTQSEYDISVPGVILCNTCGREIRDQFVDPFPHSPNCVVAKEEADERRELEVMYRDIVEPAEGA